MRLSLTKRDGFYVILAGIIVVIYVATANGGFPLDDSWIHQVYARNLAENGEWAFISGEPSGASTSPLYTVLLAAGYLLNVPYDIWAHLLGAIALGASGMLAGRLADRLLPFETFTTFITGGAIVISWHLAWAAVAGMETMIFCMFTLLLAYLTWRELDALSQDASDVMWRGGVFGIVAALATLTRPEGVLLAGLCGLLLLLVRPNNSWSKIVMWSIGAIIGFFVFVLPYMLLNLALNDSILPATSDAKYAQHEPLLEVNYFVRLLSMFIPIIAGGQFLLIPGIIYYVVWVVGLSRRNTSHWLLLLPILWGASLIALYAARLPASYQHGRYVIPALPLLLIAGVIGTVLLVRRIYHKTLPRVAMVTITASAIFAFIYFGFILGVEVYDTDVAVIDEEMVASAQWIADNIPAEELLAVHDIGAVGYFAPRTILDVAGLVSPEVVPIYHNDDALWALMEARDARYLMAFPDQIPGGSGDDPRLCPLFESPGRTSFNLGGPKMVVYQLSWNLNCP